MLVPLLLLFSILYLVVNLRPLYANSKPNPPTPTSEPATPNSASTPSARQRRLEDDDGDMPLLHPNSSNGDARPPRIGNLNIGRKPIPRRRFNSPPLFGRAMHQGPVPAFNLTPASAQHPRNAFHPPPRFSPSPNTTPSLSPSRSPSIPSGPGSGTGAAIGGPQDVAGLKVEVESLRLQLAEARAREEQAHMQVHHLQQVIAGFGAGPSPWLAHLQHQAQAAWSMSPPHSLHQSVGSPQNFSPSPPSHQQPPLMIPTPQYAAGYSTQLQHPHMAPGGLGLGVPAISPYNVQPPMHQSQQGYPFPHTYTHTSTNFTPHAGVQQAHIPTSPPQVGQPFAEALTAALAAASVSASPATSPPLPGTMQAQSPRGKEREREAARQDLFGAILRRPGMHSEYTSSPPTQPVQPAPSTSTSLQSMGADNSLSLSLSSLDSLPSPLTADGLAETDAEISQGEALPPADVREPAEVAQRDGSGTVDAMQEMINGVDAAMSEMSEFDGKIVPLGSSATAPSLLIHPCSPDPADPTELAELDDGSDTSVYSQRSSMEAQPLEDGSHVEKRKRHMTLHTSLPRSEQDVVESLGTKEPGEESLALDVDLDLDAK